MNSFYDVLFPVCFAQFLYTIVIELWDKMCSGSHKKAMWSPLFKPPSLRVIEINVLNIFQHIAVLLFWVILLNVCFFLIILLKTSSSILSFFNNFEIEFKYQWKWCCCSVISSLEWYFWLIVKKMYYKAFNISVHGRWLASCHCLSVIFWYLRTYKCTWAPWYAIKMYAKSVLFNQLCSFSL